MPYAFDSYIKKYDNRNNKMVAIYGLTENKKEQRRIRKMNKLRKQGLSYQSIAMELNRLRYKTKNEKKWAAMTVKRTLDSYALTQTQSLGNQKH